MTIKKWLFTMHMVSYYELSHTLNTKAY